MSQSGQQRMGGAPMFILSEDSQRTQGEDAQSSNISAGKAISEAVRTTLGPRGMDKMLVADGDVVITNDGATILEEMEIEHPAADMLVEVAQTQEEEVGDGTTTASVLAGELLSKAEELLDDDVHPTTIVEGYHEASSLAREAIDDLVIDGDLDADDLIRVAESSMTGKGTGDVAAGPLAETVVDAVDHVRTDEGVDRDSITIHAQVGSSSSATDLIEGVIVDEEPVHDNMPRTVEDAAIAVVDSDLELKESSIDAEYNVNNVDQLNAAIESEEAELRERAQRVVELGADVLFASGDIDDRVASYLAKDGVLAVDDVSDLGAIINATGASRAASVEDLEADELGNADSISVRNYGDDDLTFIEGGAAAKAVTIFARGGTEHVVDELERSIRDALDVVTAALERGGVVPGAGATEIVIADYVRDHAAGVEGRKQLAVEAFADAVDVLPRTLASNTGMDPIDALVDLRAAYENDTLSGVLSSGQSGDIADPLEAGVLDPAAVKREAVDSATEAATMIVRIDDVISAS
ncbi:Thermosome subunit alpha protein [Halorhabdus tiamatea SARL4B]|uniref:Thermosome subunit alpha protein n=3 Tax=Halorhabdus TaxID=146825 RepID=U2FFR3_9EURY|nr:Thermosome subunit alpha protein [Halorhabdus tiamatea SARL4B]